MLFCLFQEMYPDSSMKFFYFYFFYYYYFTLPLYLHVKVPTPPVNQSFNLIGILRHIDSIGLRVERPCQPCRRRIPGYFSRSLGHTNAEVNPTMPKMCTRSFHVLQRLNNSGAIYAMYTVVRCPCKDILTFLLRHQLGLY